MATGIDYSHDYEYDSADFNCELAERVLDHLDDHPERHDQSVWWAPEDSDCDSVGCIAGWVCALGGAAEEIESMDAGDPDRGTKIAARAQQLLWLDGDRSYHLFCMLTSESTALLYLSRLIDPWSARSQQRDEAEKALIEQCRLRAANR